METLALTKSLQRENVSQRCIGNIFKTIGRYDQSFGAQINSVTEKLQSNVVTFETKWQEIRGNR